jgi:hypothetical protein
MRTTVFATLALLATISSPGLAEDAADQTALAPHVEMEIIGSVPGAQWTYPNAINKRGLVVGGAKIQGVWNAFIWSRERGSSPARIAQTGCTSAHADLLVTSPIADPAGPGTSS